MFRGRYASILALPPFPNPRREPLLQEWHWIPAGSSSVNILIAKASSYWQICVANEAAPDERDFYGMKSLHFEKLDGSRSHQRSFRLNKQWRLIVELVGEAPNKIVRVIRIEDYH